MADQTIPMDPPAEAERPRRTPWLVGITVTVLIIIVLVSAAIRLMIDVPNVEAGIVPEDPYAARFAHHCRQVKLYASTKTHVIVDLVATMV